MKLYVLGKSINDNSKLNYMIDIIRRRGNRYFNRGFFRAQNFNDFRHLYYSKKRNKSRVLRGLACGLESRHRYILR